MFEPKGSLEERIDKLEKDSEKLQDYARRFREAAQEESVDRIEDFDILKLKNIPWVDVREYGAKGDGSTDDTVAIQAAIDSLSSGGVIFFPLGTYNTDTTLAIGNGVSLVGFSKKGSIIYKTTGGTGGAGRVIENENYGSSYDENIIIKDLTIRGTYQSASSDYEHNHCIGLYKTRHVTIENCYLYDAGGDGISARQAENTTIRKNEIYNCGRNGISPTAGSFLIEENKISGITGDNGPGAIIDGEPNNTSESLDITIRKNNIDATANGIVLADLQTATGGTTMISGTIEDNDIDGGSRGVYIKSTNSIKAKKIKVIGNDIVGADRGIHLDSLDRVVIKDNYIDSTAEASYGIDINANYLRIEDNIVIHSTNYTIGDANGKTGNIIMGNVSSGYSTVLKNSTNCIMKANIFDATTGLTVQGTSAEKNIITENDFSACTTPINYASGGDMDLQRVFNNIGLQTIHSQPTAPVAGTWATGDITWKTDAVAGGKIGWICIAAGTPGTWKAFGAIDA
jgi:parallel beta-helix repeat protein